MDRRAIRLLGEVVVILALLALALKTFGASKAKPDGDEAEWIGTSAFFVTLFVQHDVSPAAWPDTYWTRTQPMMARYAIGGWLWARGYDATSFDPRYTHSLNWATNQRAGTAPSYEMLDEARLAMRGLAAFTVVWVYLAVRFAAGPVGGLVAALLVVGSPYLTEHLVRAKGDTTLMFFWMAALAAIVAGLRRIEWARRSALGLAALGGILLGLAFGSKLTAVLGFLAVALWTVGAALASSRRIKRRWPILGRLLPVDRVGASRRDMRRAHFGAIVLVGSLVAFLASNPFLYPDPVGRTWLLFQNRREEMAAQAAAEPYRAVDTVQDKLYQTWDRSLVNEAWGPSRFGYPVEAMLAPLGLGWLLVRSARFRPGVDALLLIWALCVFGGVASGLGYRLQHYFVPSAVVGDLLAGLGVGYTCQAALALLAARVPDLARRAPRGRAALGARPLAVGG